LQRTSELGTPASLLVPIHRAGWPFIAGFFAAAIVLGFLWKPLFWLGLLATGWCAYFFRDPPRVSPTDPGLVLSPADGVVAAIRPRRPPPELDLESRPLPCVSIFLNILDVHVNRTPVQGRVLKRAYHPGKFLNAAHDKASDENERQSFRLLTRTGHVVGLVQIAGLVARRIVGFVGEGEALEAGQRIGLIRFGSRCDVYLPDGIVPLVLEGQRAIAGETVLADLTGNQAPHQGRTS
jgi:phosphatidylserine decarboxylase